MTPERRFGVSTPWKTPGLRRSWVKQRVLLKNTHLMSRSHMTLDVPPGPPPEVQLEIAEAWGRAQRPLPEGLELDFDHEPAIGRASGVLRLPDGTVIARISAAEALAIACGDAAVLPDSPLSV
jgi:hypothetical protein